MGTPVKTRSYSSDRRRADAARRRRRVLEIALQSFTTAGYSGTSMSAVARQAGVAVDTIYATIGRKPQLLIEVLDLVLGEMALDEDGAPVTALQRRYVEEVRAQRTAAGKIRRYAEALGLLLPRTAPLLEALREAGVSDPECQAAWQSVDQRRAANMRLFASDLRSTGELRDELDDETVADLVWSMNSPTYFLSLTRRGWSPADYSRMLDEVWSHTFLKTRPSRRQRGLVTHDAPQDAVDEGR